MFLRPILNAMRSGLMNLDQHKDSLMVVLFFYTTTLVVFWVDELFVLFVDI